MGEPSFRSVVEMLHHRVQSTPDSDAVYQRVGGAWQALSWRDLGQRVRHLACGLRALGLEDGERVAILSSTRVEWILADLAIMAAAGVTTTVYPSQGLEDTAFILQDADVVVVVVENARQLDRVDTHRAALPRVRHVILLEGEDPRATSLDEVAALGRRWDVEHPGAYDEVAARPTSGSLATILYTSGTTGRPKGVELTHDAWVYEGEAIDAIGLLTPMDRQLLFLPLAHSFAKVLEIAFIRIGTPTAVDGDVDALLDNLEALQPTMAAGVPRVYERIHHRLVSRVRERGAVSARLLAWAVDVGKEVVAARERGGAPGPWLLVRHALADKLVLSRVRARLGGRLRYLISGAAPLDAEVAQFFHACGIPVLEGYGLTESAAASFVNRPDDHRLGTVGKALPGTQVRLGDDGEIFLRGRGVMAGYHGLPEETRAVLQDGWLATGDVGTLDEGYLRLLDRKSDLLRTSTGKFVAPRPLEQRLQEALPLVAHALVFGERRPCCVALFTLREAATRRWAVERHVEFHEYAALLRHPDLLAELQRGVDRVNEALAPWERVRRFAVVPRELSAEHGELTPKLSVRRKVVERNHRPLVDALYADLRPEP